MGAYRVPRLYTAGVGGSLWPGIEGESDRGGDRFEGGKTRSIKLRKLGREEKIENK